jgi:RNA polymerase sigma-19 factor, ECF subfamily
METSTPGDSQDRLRFNYEGQLIEYLAQILGTASDACELARNSFAALEAAYPLRLPQFPKAALFGIATSLALRMLHRRRASETKLQPKDMAADLEMSAPCTDRGRQVTPEEVSQPIAEAIRELPPPLRTVFIMAHLQGKHRIEIAAALGIPVKRVDRRLTKALSTCRRYLSSREID